MPTVALVTSSIARTHEGFRVLHERSMEALSNAFHLIGRETKIVEWHNPSVDWSIFESALVTTAWDYSDDLEKFLDMMSSVSKKTTLFNEIGSMQWNAEKNYLFELEKEGTPIIPTKFIPHLTVEAAEDCFDLFSTDDLVLKPMVGAAGHGQFRLKRTSRTSSISTASSEHGWLVQPFQDSILTEGELSLVYFGGIFSHAIRKCPRKGEYRVQTEYGGTDQKAAVTKEAGEIAEKILSLLPVIPLFGRVDLVRLNSGELGIMECEFIEPYLYPEYCPDFAKTFSQAYLDALNSKY